MDLNVDSDDTGHVGIAPFPAPRIRMQPIGVILPRRNATSFDKLSFNWVIFQLLFVSFQHPFI